MLPIPSLKSRIMSSKLHTQRVSKVPHIPTIEQARPTAYKLWNMDTMQEAIAEVEKGMSIRRAAECYKIPRTTLQDYVSGQSTLSSRSGAPILTVDEESELATFLVEVAKIGYPHTRQQVLNKVQAIVDAKGLNRLVTFGWWQSFAHRHPDLTLKTAAPLGMSRAKATDRNVLQRYFTMLEECLDTHDIMDKPSRIYNCDETGIPLNPPCPKVIDKVGTRNPCYVTGDSKVQVTVLACTNAAGIVIPPMVVMKKRPITEHICEGEVPGTAYGLSDSGWMNRELFSTWFSEHFLQYVHRDRPILLLMDGHSSHYDPSTITMAAEEGVILCALPPNTTHLTQPLDRSCFAPLKAAWREARQHFQASHPNRVLTIHDFNKVFSEAWIKGMSMNNITQGFKVAGIYPFNPDALLDATEICVMNKPKTIMEKTGIAYIPLYGHAPSEGNPAEMLPKEIDRTYICTARQQSSISNMLIKPIPPSAIPTKKEKSAGQILTREGNLKLIKERQKLKEENEKMKEEKRKAREEKKQLKEENRKAKEENVTEKKKGEKQKANIKKKVSESETLRKKAERIANEETERKNENEHKVTEKNLKANTEVQKKDERYAVTFTPGPRLESRKSSRKATIIEGNIIYIYSP